jgi:hypothetical protein
VGIVTKLDFRFFEFASPLDIDVLGAVDKDITDRWIFEEEL